MELYLTLELNRVLVLMKHSVELGTSKTSERSQKTSLLTTQTDRRKYLALKNNLHPYFVMPKNSPSHSHHSRAMHHEPGRLPPCQVQVWQQHHSYHSGQMHHCHISTSPGNF